jgi:hypothetical protein
VPAAKQTLGCGHEMPNNDPDVLGVGMICQPVPSQRSTMGAASKGLKCPKAASPTAMHEFADEQSTPNRLVRAATFSVGVTVHAADAGEGARSIAAAAKKTRQDARSDICPTEATPLVSTGQTPPAPSRALDVSWRIAEDGHPVTARRCKDPRKRRFG